MGDDVAPQPRHRLKNTGTGPPVKVGLDARGKQTRLAINLAIVIVATQLGGLLMGILATIPTDDPMGAVGAIVTCLTMVAAVLGVAYCTSEQLVWRRMQRVAAENAQMTEYHVVADSVSSHANAADQLVTFEVAVHNLGVTYDTLVVPMNCIEWRGCRAGDGRRDKILTVNVPYTHVFGRDYVQREPGISAIVRAHETHVDPHLGIPEKASDQDV
jgi:hypothetical protein